MAGQLLEAAKGLQQRSQEAWDTAKPLQSSWRDFGDWRASPPDSEFGFSARKIRLDPFYSLTMSEEIGQAAHKLMNRQRLGSAEIGVRYCEDALLALPPNEENRSHRWHQDEMFGTDRTGGFNVWIAIDEVLAEQGAMRFLTGSHREGPLGQDFGDTTTTVVDHYPRLLDIYELSPAFHYKPGDATIHYGLTVHGTPENRTDKTRWSYVPTYIPADNVQILDHGLGMPEPHERFPLVFSAGAS
jgi:hypothetical protein